MSDLRAKNRLLELLVELLDIPPSHYVKAKDRARSLGEYLLRPESAVADFNPDVYPQGSFRYGTVIRPLLKSDEYDLDLVCALGLSKYDVTQKYVKELLGGEIQSYARAKQFKEPAEEKPRCWRLNYADDVSFHMDIVPSVPEDAGTIKLIVARQVPAQLAEHAIAITDQRHPRYTAVDPSWFSSNPRGVAAWFEDQMRQVAEARMRELVL